MINLLLSMISEHKAAMWWITAVSCIVVVGSLFMVPWLVTRIPADYFMEPRRPRTHFADQHPLLRWTGLIIKNLVGALLVLAGLAMILLPGQGLLTIAIGVLLVDFPGKHNLESKIIRKQPVLKSINWIRHKAGADELRLDESPKPTEENC